VRIQLEEDKSKDKFSVQGMERHEMEHMIEALETHIGAKSCWYKRPFTKLLGEFYRIKD
jgi:hypothetical protein